MAKRKPIFQEVGSDSPVKTDPPFQPTEELEDVIGGEDDAPQPEKEIIPPSEPEIAEPDEQARSVEEPETASPPEQAQATVEDVLPGGWRFLTPAQHTGAQYLITDDLEKEGVRAFWRRTRVLNHNRWVACGKWSDALTRADILFNPIYYKDVA